MMHNTTLGRTSLAVPRLVFGSMARGKHDDAARMDVLQTAIQSGLTTIDTAPLYDFGEAERQIGLALQSLPGIEVQILTKVGLRWDGGDHGEVLFEYTDPHGNRRTVRRNSRPESICWEVEQSLQRLQLDTLDLVQVHQPDELTPLDETMGALLDLRAAGKLRHIGVSNFSISQIKQAQRALGDVPLASVQPQYNLLQRQIETDLQPFCIAEHIGIIAYSPLAAGHLTGSSKVDTPASINNTVQQILLPMAEKYEVSPAALALAWVFHQPGVNAAIAGASHPMQVQQQIKALTVSLSAWDRDSLTTHFARVPLDPPPPLWKRLGRRVRRLLGSRVPRQR
ncbi:MAG: aldo/keto reductase [bacterium]